MKKTKIIMSVFVSTSILLGGVVSASAKVNSYVIKNNDKLYNYNISDLFQSNNFKLLSEFLDSTKERDITMINDDELSKFIDYKVLKNNEETFGKYFDYKTFSIVNSGVDKPKYIYDRVSKNGVVVNKLNISGDNLNIDFSKENYGDFEDVTITGKNVVINNLKIKGNLDINTNQKGAIALNNVNTNSINILKAPEEAIDLVNVVTDSLILKSEEGTSINLKEKSKIKETKVQEKAKLTNILGDFGTLTVELKNKDTSKIELNGDFKNIVVNNGKNLVLGKDTKINEIKAKTDLEILKDNTATVINLIKDGNINIKTSLKPSDNKNVSINQNNSSKSNNSSKANNSGSSSSGINKNENKADGSKNSGNSNTSKPNESNNKGNETRPNQSNNNGSVNQNDSNKQDKDQNKPNVPDSNVSKPTESNKNQNFLDKDKSCIMNIQFVNYAVIVLSEGTLNDYKFFINGTQINPIKVNEEGTILKFEVDNRKDKELKVVKSDKEEKLTLKYKQY